MSDLHGWITQQIDETERLARAATSGPWAADPDSDGLRRWTIGVVPHNPGVCIAYLPSTHEVAADAAHIALNDPATVLRRCAADRKTLARHRLNPDAYWADAAMCEGCGTEGEMGYAVTENLNDCPELLDLAEAHGLTPEILAGLDRPQESERPEPGPGFQMPDAIAESLVSFWLGTRPVEPRSEVKAMEILGPELKKISGYVPTTNPEA